MQRRWRISSAQRRNRIGEPTGDVLFPEGQPTLLADPGSSVARRAGFAAHHLWVSRAEPGEYWPFGPQANQNPGGDDIVVWHTFGQTRFPRFEDWPIIPADYACFTMKPHAFFDRNSTMDVPASAAHCTPGEHDAHHA